MMPDSGRCANRCPTAIKAAFGIRVIKVVYNAVAWHALVLVEFVLNTPKELDCWFNIRCLPTSPLNSRVRRKLRIPDISNNRGVSAPFAQTMTVRAGWKRSRWLRSKYARLWRAAWGLRPLPARSGAGSVDVEVRMRL